VSGAFLGHKVLAVSYNGTLQLLGKKGTSGAAVDADPSNSGTSWVRLTKTLIGGEMDLTVDRPVDWQAGDWIVLATTDYLPGDSEDVQIKSVDSDGMTIHLSTPVKNHHYGSTYPIADNVAASLGLDFKFVETRAAVGLLSRSIRIVSQGNSPTDAFTEQPGNYFGGHTIVRQGFASYQMQGVEFYQLGQGGSIMHYPVHFHMARKTPQPSTSTAPAITFVKDCSVYESTTRWYTIHATQGVTLARNVGYKSIGHGYYLEDGTEINNKLYSNLGVLARAAVDNTQNPRKVPGILASPGEPQAEIVPYHSDYDHPTLFWMMNLWNDFVGNAAEGAGACGVCYWLVPGANSGLSQYEAWDSYASMQIGLGRAGMTPLEKFEGNFCLAAMSSVQTVGNTTPCLGVGDIPDGQHLKPVPNRAAPDRNSDAAKNYYPVVNQGGGHFATVCQTADCSQTPRCGGTQGTPEDACTVTALDHYTTSFNWAQTNYAAIWLRPWWFLLSNSAVTDAQNGGLTFVTGGGYTRSDAAVGYWSLARKNVFVGNTQPNVVGTQYPQNAFAANIGPFNEASNLACDDMQNNYCLSFAQGISMPIDNFGVNQRLFNIYDGPAYQAYLDVHTTTLTDLHSGRSRRRAVLNQQIHVRTWGGHPAGQV
jgi:hypothetical protein